MGHPGDFAQPLAEGHGVVPGNAHHRLVGAIEVFVLPVERLRVTRGLKEPAVLGVGGLGHGDVKGIDPHPVEGDFIGITARFAHGTAKEIITAWNLPEADALGLPGFLGMGGPHGQQQPPEQQKQTLRFSSVNFAAIISRQFCKTFHTDHI
jgi:hypothetical protein